MSWERLTEGDSFTGDSLATRLAYMQNRINDLPAMSVEKGSLTHEHLPSVVIDKAHAVLPSNADHEYNDIIEPYPGWNTVAGWKVINTAGSLGIGTKLEAAFSGLVDTSDVTKKVLILGNVNLVDIQEPATSNVSPDYYACFAFQVQDEFGTWHHIARSERYTDSQSWEDTSVSPTEFHQLTLWKDIPIRCLLTVADGLGKIAAVRMVVSVNDSTPTFAAQMVLVSLRQGNLTALAFKAGAM